jgi:hypothetical protein
MRRSFLNIGWRDQRGIALPMALIVLVILSSLMLAFAVLSQSEPTIAANQSQVAVARGLAESGMERAIWALTAYDQNPNTAGAVQPPANTVVATAPYNGGYFSATGLGGFTLNITGASPTNTSANLVAVGWIPDNASGTNTHRRVIVTLMKFPDFGFNPPCALCVKGDVQVAGSAVVDSRPDTSCGNKYGVVTTGSTYIGNNNNGNNGSIYGAVDGNNDKNQPGDYLQNQPPSTFDNMTLSQDQLNALKAIAKANGTYYGPGYPSNWNGNVTFNSGSQIPKPNGVVFVDTRSGDPMTPTNTSDFATVDIHGNPFVGTDPNTGRSAFTGWIIVMGSVAFNANGVLNGMLYTGQDLTSNNGTPQINGVAIAQNMNNANGSQVDVSESGNALVTFNCDNARRPPGVPRGWFVKAGTYREVSD